MLFLLLLLLLDGLFFCDFDDAEAELPVTGFSDGDVLGFLFGLRDGRSVGLTSGRLLMLLLFSFT